MIIPDINFTCDGTVTGCIVGATLGQGELSLNLEIWRAVNGSLHRKVGVSRLQNGTSIGRRVYEYRLMEPLAFRAGDILGISRNDGQGRLYWEESRRLAVYHKNDRYDDEVEFLKSKVLYERNYPLITALTGIIHVDLMMHAIVTRGMRVIPWYSFFPIMQLVCVALYVCARVCVFT